MNDRQKSLLKVMPVKALEGIYRRTLLYNDDLMMCHFLLEKGSEIPIHSHPQHQLGFMLKGKLKFITDEGEFIVNEGDCYLFNSNERHGAKILEDSEVLDVFSPSREDYK